MPLDVGWTIGNWHCLRPLGMEFAVVAIVVMRESADLFFYTQFSQLGAYPNNNIMAVN
jgi:hypothetical protein